MTKINAEVVLASKNAVTNDVLVTWKLTFPRIILAETLTHRVTSKNTSSSRAIPGKKQRKAVYDDPFVPVYIGANQKGMSAGAELTGWRRKGVELVWSGLRYPNLAGAWVMEKLGAHKQIANRVLEPWVWTVQIFSATELDNFFLLRDHPMAEPHFHELARQMRSQYDTARVVFEHVQHSNWMGKYQVLQPGEWHLPLVGTWKESLHWMRNDPYVGLEELQILSTARCARTSYTQPEDGKVIDLETAKRIYSQTLMASSNAGDPKHLSPLEHVACAMDNSSFVGNFKGFKQFRKEVE